MANPEHLEILKQGVEDWNDWKKNNPQIVINLQEANLRRANLPGADLSYADLSGANLSEAFLFGTDLSGANLSEADLTGTNLAGAKLHNSLISDHTKFDSKWQLVWEIVNEGAKDRNLSKADLSWANLSGVDLSGADITGANLKGANLSGARLHNSAISDQTKFSSKWQLVWGIINQGAIRKNLSKVDLSSSDLSGANLSGADLSGANLSGANLSGANLSGADLSGADLSGTNLTGANLFKVKLHYSVISDQTKLDRKWKLIWDIVNRGVAEKNLSGEDLSGADLSEMDLSEVDLSGADLSEAILIKTLLIGTNLNTARLNNCHIYGISVWDIKGRIRSQKDLVITASDQPKITVDNIKVAQFIYLLLENPEIRNVIETITSKSVLILGRFSEPRKKALDEIKNRLRLRNYLPILFDFSQPASKSLIDTVRILAQMSKFVIVDLTDSRDARREIEVVTKIDTLPLRPIVLATETQQEYGWFKDYLVKETVIWPYEYQSENALMEEFEEQILKPAEDKCEELKRKRLEIEWKLSKKKQS